MPTSIQCYNRGTDGVDVQVGDIPVILYVIVGMQGSDGEWV